MSARIGAASEPPSEEEYVSTSFSNTRSTLKCNLLMHFIKTFYKELIKKHTKKEKI